MCALYSPISDQAPLSSPRSMRGHQNTIVQLPSSVAVEDDIMSTGAVLCRRFSYG